MCYEIESEILKSCYYLGGIGMVIDKIIIVWIILVCRIGVDKFFFLCFNYSNLIIIMIIILYLLDMR